MVTSADTDGHSQIEAPTTVGCGVAAGSRRRAGLAGVGGVLEACLWMELTASMIFLHTS